MKKLIQKIVFFFELRSYGVCDWWGQKLGVPSQRVRLFFIYVSFIGIGSPILIYLIMGWIKENKHIFLLRPKKKSIWEL